jgi:hypothetical protein
MPLANCHVESLLEYENNCADYLLMQLTNDQICLHGAQETSGVAVVGVENIL